MPPRHRLAGVRATLRAARLTLASENKTKKTFTLSAARKLDADALVYEAGEVKCALFPARHRRATFGRRPGAASVRRSSRFALGVALVAIVCLR